MDLDADNMKTIIGSLGIKDKITDETIKDIIDELKVNLVKKKDFLMFLEKKSRKLNTYVNKKIQIDEFKINENTNVYPDETETGNEQNFLKVKEESDVVKDLLKQEPPGLTKLKNIDDFLKMWKLNEPNIRKIILNIKCNPVSPVDVVIVHKEISYVLTEKKYFTEAFKNCLIKYIKTVWKKNEAKAYEDIYQEIYDLLPLSDLSSAKNIKDLKKLFEQSHKEIVRDILECPGITLKREDVLELHKKILTDISDDQCPFFERLKKCLIEYKKGGDEKDSQTIMRQWDNIDLILQMNNLFAMKDIEKIKEYFETVKALVKKNLLNILDLSMKEDEINILHDTILKILIPKNPYYDEVVQLVNIYLDSVANKHNHDIELCRMEFLNLSSRFDELSKKRNTSFTSTQSKEELLKAWRDDEKHLIYISNDIDGLTRKEIKNFHNEIYYTFAGNISSFFEMKKQLSTYSQLMTKGDFKEIKRAMADFANFMIKENAPEEKKALMDVTLKNAPNFKAFKDRKVLEEAWIGYTSLSRNMKLLTNEQCPINSKKLDFLNDSIKIILRNKETDFDWFKTLLQNLAMNFYNQDFKNMYENYNAVNRYKPEKKV